MGERRRRSPPERHLFVEIVPLSEPESRMVDITEGAAEDKLVSRLRS